MTPADHITALRAAGMSMREIGDAAGMSDSTVRHALNGNHSDKSAAAILAVAPPEGGTRTCPDCGYTTPPGKQNPRQALAMHRTQKHSAPEPLESPGVLRGGRWAPNGRGTLVWKEELT